ncbi:replication stress response regulator SDE2 [Colletes gigas]|uniref:replication stress response regulator SDE2 n=1 Tax=Colletes gigas TaxID=935657 RepID=UPI001C9B7700|nr:replication stress response regulator SDE2 [Colletes gigas]
MLNVQISTASGVKQYLTVDTALKVCELRNQIEELTNFSQENFYIVQNGKLVDGNDTCYPGYVSVVPRLFGGKGGFGSMLRAIGAQIEKTTNREACRDLSGRRLRDINEEKRLKVWIEKQGKREEEAAERKKKKLQRLCAEPKHEFKDPNYDLERSVLTERVGDAVEEGLKIACTSGTKRKHNEEFKPNKKKTLLDFDIDSDELGSSDDSEEDETKSKTVDQEEQISNDSGHSSDESRTAHKDTNRIESECSETSSDNQSSDQVLSNADEKKKDCVAEDSEFSESNSPKPTDEDLKVPT